MVVVGNPANTNAYICKMYAKGIPPENFTCLTRLDQNRAQAQVHNLLYAMSAILVVLLYVMDLSFVCGRRYTPSML